MRGRALPFVLAYVAVFVIGVQGVLAAWVAGMRSGLDSPPWLAVACLTLTAAVVFAPSLLSVERLRSWEPTGWPASMIALVVLASLPLAFILGPGILILHLGIASAGMARALPRLKGMGRTEFAFLLLGAPVVASYLFLSFHGRFFAVALAPDLARAGLISADTLFHASISHMLQNFGVASTGLDGLVPIRYHVGSHLWFAALSFSTGVPALFAYSYGQLLVALPVLVGALMWAVHSASAPRNETVATFTIAGVFVLLADVVGWNDHYVSESQTFGVIVVLLALPAVLGLLREAARGATSGGSTLRLVALLAAVGLAIYAKVSAGAVLAAGVGWAAFRAWGPGWRLLATGLGLVGIALWASLTVVSEAHATWSLFHFYRSAHALTPAVMAGYTAPLLPAISLVLLLVARRRLRCDGEAGEARLRAEWIGLVTLVALAPGLLLAIPMPNPWWFANISQWCAVPLLAAAATDWRALPTRPVRLLLAILGATTLTVWTLFQGPDRFEAVYAPVFVQAGLIDQASAAQQRWPVLRYLASRAFRGEPAIDPRAQYLTGGIGTRIQNAVDQGLGDSPRDDVVVFVPPTNRDVWAVDPSACYRRPFLVPALTGLPLIRGLPPGCPVATGWGFSDYGEDSRSVPTAPTELCERAVARGFRRVFVLRSLRQQRRNSILVCRNRGKP